MTLAFVSDSDTNERRNSSGRPEEAVARVA
jgi:hypothetical protein